MSSTSAAAGQAEGQAGAVGEGEGEAANRKQKAQEHNRRKKRRRKERGWAKLVDVLKTIPASLRPSRRELAASAAEHESWDWAKVPKDVDPMNSLTNERAAVRGQRKRDQALGFARILHRMFDETKPMVLVDFGSGSGNLTLPLAWRFPNWRFVGVDMKDRCVELLRERAQASGLTNVQGVEALVGDAVFEDLPGGRFDVALALHACGSATDDSLRRAVDVGASFIVSPCCAGKMEASISGASGVGITAEDFAYVRSFADHAADGKKESREAKMIVEADRMQWTAQQDYESALLHLTPDHDYPKNDVIVGAPKAARVLQGILQK